MRVGRFISLPNERSEFGRIRDEFGNAYTVDTRQVPKNASTEKDYAFKVDLWENGGLAYEIKED